MDLSSLSTGDRIPFFVALFLPCRPLIDSIGLHTQAFSLPFSPFLPPWPNVNGQTKMENIGNHVKDQIASLSASQIMTSEDINHPFQAQFVRRVREEEMRKDEKFLSHLIYWKANWDFCEALTIYSSTFSSQKLNSRNVSLNLLFVGMLKK